MAGILLTQQHANKMHISSVTNSQGTDILKPHFNKKMIKYKKKSSTIQSTDKTKK